MTPFCTPTTYNLNNLFFSCVFEKENAKKNSSPQPSSPFVRQHL